MKKETLTRSKTPEELLEWMNNNLVYHPVVKKYLYTPEQVVEKKLAHCWESTDLERVELTQLGYKTKVLALFTDDLSVTHSTLIFKNNDVYCWFEWAWYKYHGVYEFKTEYDAIKHVISLFEKENKESNSYYYGDIEIEENMKSETYFQKTEAMYKIPRNKKRFKSW